MKKVDVIKNGSRFFIKQAFIKLFDMHNMLFSYLFYDGQFIRFSHGLITRINIMFKLTTSYFITFDFIHVIINILT